MESRNITLTLDKAKEWYKKGGELKEVAMQAFTKNELVELPKTWEEFCENYPVTKTAYLIDVYSIICPLVHCSVTKRDKNTLPSKEAARAHLALMQLHQLRDCYRQGWVPDWEDSDPKFIIIRENGGYSIARTRANIKFLTFQTEEIAEAFLENFRDLIEKAGDLI